MSTAPTMLRRARSTHSMNPSRLRRASRFRRALRPIAAAVTGLLAAATLTLGSALPAQAAPGVVPETVNLVVGQPVDPIVIVDDPNALVMWGHTERLPAGLQFGQLDSPEYTLQGTPTETGTFELRLSVAWSGELTATDHVVTITVSDAPTVPAPPVWQTTSVGPLTMMMPATARFVATDAMIYAVTAGTLPPGLWLQPDGALMGIPQFQGVFTLTITATGPGGATAREFTIAVNSPGAFTPIWMTGSIGPMTVGSALAIQLNALHATTYAVATGALPPGVTILPHGAILGIPSEAGTWNVTLAAAGPDGATSFRDFTIVVNPAPQTPVWVTDSIGPFSVGTPVTAAIEATHATHYDMVASSLAGLEFGADGRLTGTPSIPGDWFVEATPVNGAVRGETRRFDFEVRALPTWTTTALAPMRQGVPFSQRLDATGAETFAIQSGALPAGLTLSADGVLTGVPEAAGRYEFVVAANNGTGPLGDATQRFEGDVAPALVEWVTDSLPAQQRNVEVHLALEATHATGFELSDGALPDGLSLSLDGVVSGIPTKAGTFAFEITARNAAHEPATRAFELVIGSPTVTLAFAGEPGDAAAGIPIEADASGLAPSTAWTLTMYSEPVELAAGVASVDGDLRVATRLPATVPFGAHEVRLAALAADGTTLHRSVWFSVGADGRLVEVSQAGPVNAPPAPAPAPGPGSAPAPAPSTQALAPDATAPARIAATGIEPTGWLAAGAALLLAGLAALGFGRRRARG